MANRRVFRRQRAVGPEAELPHPMVKRWVLVSTGIVGVLGLVACGLSASEATRDSSLPILEADPLDAEATIWVDCDDDGNELVVDPMPSSSTPPPPPPPPPMPSSSTVEPSSPPAYPMPSASVYTAQGAPLTVAHAPSNGNAGIRPLDRPRTPKQCKPKTPKPCVSPNVPAATAAACPPDQDIDRTDTVNCTPVGDGGAGNWSPPPPSTERYQCSGTPHYPCYPSATNGNASHTHHDRMEYNFGNGCCFLKKTDDVKPVTCK